MLQVMVPFNYTEFIDGVSFLVKNKFIPMNRIDDAVERILRVKFVMGLFENPLADFSMAKYLGSKVRLIISLNRCTFRPVFLQMIIHLHLLMKLLYSERRSIENWPGKP